VTLLIVGVAAAAHAAACGPGPADPTPRSADAGPEVPTDAGLDATPASPDAAGCASKRSTLDGLCQPLVFVTSETFVGDLGGDPVHVGVERGDALCQAEADKVFTGKVFRAWLSAKGLSAKDRLEHSATSYRLIDGTTVAASWERFAGPLHVTSIDLKLDGTRVREPVFTGTLADGTADDRTCDDWSSAAAESLAAKGYSDTSSEGTWTNALIDNSCAELSHLYCIEQLKAPK
jgi:hypothetical protein